MTNVQRLTAAKGVGPKLPAKGIGLAAKRKTLGSKFSTGIKGTAVGSAGLGGKTTPNSPHNKAKSLIGK